MLTLANAKHKLEVPPPVVLWMKIFIQTKLQALEQPVHCLGEQQRQQQDQGYSAHHPSAGDHDVS